MNRALLSTTFGFAFALSSLMATAQKDRFAYAITDETPQGVNWSVLRVIDLQNGDFSNVILNGVKDFSKSYDASSKTPLADGKANSNIFHNSVYAPFASGVAGIALDAANNRLWYTPMFVDQLRYIDLSTMEVYHVSSAYLTNSPSKAADQSNIVTRMVIAEDGNGYALSNDAKHFVQFTTGKNPTITQLGSVIDDANNEVSIHSAKTSFGGDMIADNEGNLWVFSAFNHVFKINVATKVATHLGQLQGVPATYSTNGVAVTSDNKILAVSATSNNRFVVNPSTLEATPWEGSVGYRISDLGNSNILQTKTKPQEVTDAPVLISGVQAFPNPAVNKKFNLQFGKLAAGNYTVVISDLAGRKVYQEQVSIASTNQIKSIQAPKGIAKGIYGVSVLDKRNQSLHYTQIVID